MSKKKRTRYNQRFIQNDDDTDDRGRSDSQDRNNDSAEYSDDDRPPKKRRRAPPFTIRTLYDQMNADHHSAVHHTFDQSSALEPLITMGKTPINTDTLLYGSDMDDFEMGGDVAAAYERRMGVNQGPDNCFGCAHVGEFTPGISPTHLHALIVFMSDFDTTHIDQHAINVSKMYEQVIRTPANANRKAHQTELPPWNPATVKAHLYYHTGSILSTKLLKHSVQFLAMYVTKNMILEEDPDGFRPPSTTSAVSFIPRKMTINTKNVKALKDLTATLTQLEKLTTTAQNTQSSTIGSGELILQANKNASLDATKKTIKTGNMLVSLDCHFNPAVLNVKQTTVFKKRGRDNENDGVGTDQNQSLKPTIQNLIMPY